MFQPRSRWAAAYALCLLTTVGGRCDDIRQALLTCAQPCFDFGTLPASEQSASHTFDVENTSTETVEVLAVSTSCDCLTAELERKTIRPGEALALPVHLMFQGRSGAQRRAVHLVYRTPDAPDGTRTLTFTVQGTILTPVMRYPDSLDLGVQVPGGTATGTVELAAGQAHAFRIHNVGLDRADARADYQADTASPRHLIHLTLPVPLRIGAFSGFAIATTDLPEMPQVQIPYQGLAAPLIEAQPSVIAARRGVGLDASLTLFSAHRIAFRVTQANATDARIRVTLDPAEERPRIHVTSNALAESLHGAMVRITTDHPICRIIEVPIRASAAPAQM